MYIGNLPSEAFLTYLFLVLNSLECLSEYTKMDKHLEKHEETNPALFL